MHNAINRDKEKIERAIALARAEKPAYSHLYSFLESLFIAGAEAKANLRVKIPPLSGVPPERKWEDGFPLLNRWDFQVDTQSAGRILDAAGKAIPEQNLQLAQAWKALARAIPENSSERDRFWGSFLHHEMEPWEEWIDAGEDGLDLASILFLARSAIKPSLEFTASTLLESHPIPDSWLKGYCPVCGSFPSLLYLEGDGNRKCFCSWCSTSWDIHRIQCPYCDNRYHESLGYLALEAERQNRIVYCNPCGFYFKQVDTREMPYAPYWPLEEWTTLHLDLVAQKSGWRQPPSPAPKVYGTSE